LLLLFFGGGWGVCAGAPPPPPPPPAPQFIEMIQQDNDVIWTSIASAENDDG
jgi:hypothetical protein